MIDNEILYYNFEIINGLIAAFYKSSNKDIIDLLVTNNIPITYID